MTTITHRLTALLLALPVLNALAGEGAYDIYNGHGGLFYDHDERHVVSGGCSDDGGYSEPECSQSRIDADSARFSAGTNAYDVYSQQDTTLGPTSISGYLRTNAASYAEICCSGFALFDVQFATSSPVGVNGTIPDPRSETVLDFTLSGTMHASQPGIHKLELTTVFGVGGGPPVEFEIDNYEGIGFQQMMPFKFHGTFQPKTYYRLKVLSDAYSAGGLPWDTFSFKLTTAEVEFNGALVSAIYNLDIDGTIYNIYFDQRAGGNLFDGDATAAQIAIDAVNDVLNADYDSVDNGHPLTAPLFSVMTDMNTLSGYQSCNISAVSGCDTGDWVTQGIVNGMASDQSAAYFEKVVLTAEIDARLANSLNSFDPDSTEVLSAGFVSASTANGDSINFYAPDIDPDTVRVGPFGATQVPNAKIRDIDGDGLDDLRIKYIPAETGVACEDTELNFEAETLGGWPVAGTSLIATPECEAAACHP
ncbi:MAG: hypothetical protein ACR2QG_06745 [Gammaproteobacteria bacterium]